MGEIERTKVRVQPVLKLYLDLSKTDYLHFGFWKKGDKLTLENFQKAQERYLANLIKFIPKGVKTILDVGCGVGGNARKLASLGYKVTGICPDPYQGKLFRENTKGKADFKLTTLERYKTDQKFDLILMSESVQYIPFRDGLKKIKELLKPDGHLLISDYFKKPSAAKMLNLPSSFLKLYMAEVSRAGLKVVREQDITKGITPTLDYGSNVYCNYIKPVLNCIMTTMHVHMPPIHWLFDLFLKIPVKGRSIRQTIVNNLVPLKRDVFEKYLTYRVMLIKKK
ncbi:MAG: class I SAM-dependent methyltransferase [bacterium]